MCPAPRPAIAGVPHPRPATECVPHHSAAAPMSVALRRLQLFLGRGGTCAIRLESRKQFKGEMTVEAGAAGPRVGLAVDAAALNLKTGGICLIVGAVVFAIWRLLHGDTAAANAEAALTFVRNRPSYPTVHLFAVLAALVVVIGLLPLTRSLDRPGSSLIGCRLPPSWDRV